VTLRPRAAGTTQAAAAVASSTPSAEPQATASSGAGQQNREDVVQSQPNDAAAGGAECDAAPELARALRDGIRKHRIHSTGASSAALAASSVSTSLVKRAFASVHLPGFPSS
jgi:hypothetical protein